MPEARKETDKAAQQIGDLSKRAQQLAREADQRLVEEYTGRPSAEWIEEGTRFIKSRPWTAVAITAVAAYVLGRLRG
jgi:ElaB/YqjD/DUF883 family membrane-anchored ribosome-binding protein